MIYEIIEASKQLGFDFNTENNQGETILHDAVTKGPYELVEKLLNDAKDLNLNVNIRTKSGKTAKDYLEKSQHWRYREKKEGEKKRAELLQLYDQVAKEQPFQLSREDMLFIIKVHQDRSNHLTQNASYQTVQMIYENSCAFIKIIETLTKNDQKHEKNE